jgi:hypothetical protein
MPYDIPENMLNIEDTVSENMLNIEDSISEN